MKKQKKKIFGLLGIVLVAAVTTFAAFLPTPGAQATTSVTDTLILTVISGAAKVDIEGIKNGEITTELTKDFTVVYQATKTATVTLKYTDLDGNERVETIGTINNPGFEDGSENFTINTDDYGYGNYVITVIGEGPEGTTDPASVSFSYLPVYGEEVKVNDDYYVDVYYPPNGGSTDPAKKVTSIDVKVYYPNSDKEVPFSPITITPNADGVTRVELPFEKYGLEEGDYRVELYAYNASGYAINGNSPYTLIVQYRIGKVTPVPDTGGFFQNNNISSTDYLITGLIVFGLVAATGAAFIAKSGKKNQRKK